MRHRPQPARTITTPTPTARRHPEIPGSCRRLCQPSRRSRRRPPSPEQATAHPDSRNPAVEVAAALITAGRLGLAQHLLAQASLIDQSDAVALAALALQLRGPSGACGLEIADRLAVTSEESLTEDITCALLATGSLTTFALLSGSPQAASLLAKLPEHLDPAWAKLARLAGEVAASGALSRSALNEATDTSHLARRRKGCR